MKRKWLAVCVLAAVLFLAAPQAFAAKPSPGPYDETAVSGGDGGSAVSVLPPPPSSEHGLCGGDYCETTPNPATEAIGDRVWIFLAGGAAGLALLLSVTAIRLRKR